VTSAQPMAKKRTRDAEATKEQILTVATEEFAKAGLHAARVEEIAARTATSKHMLYYYFGSKDGLYAAVLQKAYADFRSAETTMDYDAMAPGDALKSLVAVTFDSHQANPYVIRIIMSENLDNARHLSALDQSGQRQVVIDTLARIIARGQAQGMFRQGLDPMQLHMSLSAMCFHALSNRHTFGTIFGLDFDSPEFIASRRTEIIETLMLRCLA
jgi:AcrR family transcriptional regulator